MAEERAEIDGTSSPGSDRQVTETGGGNGYVEGFVCWLKSKGYVPYTIRCHRAGLRQFLTWVEHERLPVVGLGPAAVERFCASLQATCKLRTPRGGYVHLASWQGDQTGTAYQVRLAIKPRHSP